MSGHAHHFLGRLDRVAREEVDFALALYRDHEAVAYVLETAHLPVEADRVALSIGDVREGPYVIVTRAGGFVTCLGKGMTTGDCPIVPRAQIDRALRRVKDLRMRREMAAREVRPGEDEGDILRRIHTRKNLLTREEFIALSAFKPLVGEYFVNVMLGGLKTGLSNMPKLALLARRGKLDAAANDMVDANGALLFATGHAMLLQAMGDREPLEALLRYATALKAPPSMPTTLVGITSIACRGIWAAARIGKPALPFYKTALAKPGSSLQGLDAVMGLCAIGLRHASLRREAEKALHACLTRALPDSDEITLNAAKYAAHAIGLLQAEGDIETIALDAGRDFFTTMASKLPDGHPKKPASAADVSNELARATILNLNLLLCGPKGVEATGLLLLALPLIASASAEDFYFSRDVMKHVVTPWTNENTLAWAASIVDGDPKIPVRAEPSVGRNDPCTCGSGKKWKKCCGK